MAIFDPYFRKVAEYAADLRQKGVPVQEVDCSGTVDELLAGLPIKVGPQAGSGVILRSDTYLELGSPDAGSSGLLLWAENPSLVRDGKVTIAGPDIPESEGKSLPLGQVLLISGEGLGESEHEALDRAQYVADRIEGYMIKSTPGHMWSRVSKDAAAKGFDFRCLGTALMAILKSEVEKVNAVEVLFVTSSKQDVEVLDDIAEQVRKISKDIVRENWLARGYDILECTLGWDCNSCPDKLVCDDIRQVIKIKKIKKKGEDKDAG
jgi:CO dehydrogenase/acetyl-CoA synthase beta subunit